MAERSLDEAGNGVGKVVRPDSAGHLGFAGSSTIELRTTLAGRLTYCALAASAISVAARSRRVAKLLVR